MQVQHTRYYTTRITLTCPHCDTVFQRVPSAVMRRPDMPSYCSRECANTARRAKQSRLCLYCGTLFLKAPCKIAIGCGKFCQRSCWRAYNRARSVASLAERLWASVEKTDTHWLWTGATNNKGYGQLSRTLADGHRSPIHTHRLAWQLATGEDPGPLKVLHTCDTPACVRNDEPGTYEINGSLRPRWGHLFLGTPADNTWDMATKGRAASKLTVDEVREIRARYAAGGILMKHLATEYGISQDAVYKIIRRILWSHLP